jgi:hypothetical protein
LNYETYVYCDMGQCDIVSTGSPPPRQVVNQAKGRRPRLW